jgi:hypothetical protein
MKNNLEDIKAKFSLAILQALLDEGISSDVAEENLSNAVGIIVNEAYNAALSE